VGEKRKDWMVLCRTRNQNEEQRPFEVDGKIKFQTAACEQRPKHERRRIGK